MNFRSQFSCNFDFFLEFMDVCKFLSKCHISLYDPIFYF